MKPFNLDEYLKNPSRKVVTRDSRNVIIHCTNFDGFTPIIAEIEGDIYSTAFCKNGKIIDDKDTSCDLFFAPEKKVGWINIYQGKDGPIVGNVIFASKEEAEESKKHYCGFTQDHLTTAKVEWEE